MAPEPPPAAYGLFGDRVDLAVRYANLLAGAGVERGLIGPREGARLWDRHLLNCAVAADLLPAAGTVADVGSGAGLPGIVLALCRPDLSFTLIEPALRRSVFLEECVSVLGLERAVTVRRARAEELHGQLQATVVTARAVAPLQRLVGWCWPLVGSGGALLALKGVRAADELGQARGVLPPDAQVSVASCGGSALLQPTTVLVLRKAVTPP